MTPHFPRPPNSSCRGDVHLVLRAPSAERAGLAERIDAIEQKSKKLGNFSVQILPPLNKKLVAFRTHFFCSSGHYHHGSAVGGGGGGAVAVSIPARVHPSLRSWLQLLSPGSRSSSPHSSPHVHCTTTVRVRVRVMDGGEDGDEDGDEDEDGASDGGCWKRGIGHGRRERESERMVARRWSGRR